MPTTTQQTDLIAHYEDLRRQLDELDQQADRLDREITELERALPDDDVYPGDEAAVPRRAK
jgi:prefoldin subunit 5